MAAVAVAVRPARCDPVSKSLCGVGAPVLRVRIFRYTIVLAGTDSLRPGRVPASGKDHWRS